MRKSHFLSLAIFALGLALQSTALADRRFHVRGIPLKDALSADVCDKLMNHPTFEVMLHAHHNTDPGEEGFPFILRVEKMHTLMMGDEDLVDLLYCSCNVNPTGWPDYSYVYTNGDGGMVWRINPRDRAELPDSCDPGDTPGGWACPYVFITDVVPLTELPCVPGQMPWRDLKDPNGVDYSSGVLTVKLKSGAELVKIPMLFVRIEEKI